MAKSTRRNVSKSGMIATFEALTLLYVCLIYTCSAQRYPLSYDNVPITVKTWEEIDITWQNPYNPNIPNSAQLLRPIAYAHHYHLVSGKRTYLNLTEFGVPRAKIMVTRIKPLKKIQIYQLLHGKRPVIGLYIHQTTDVRTYRFKNRQGKILTIHATPNHPFYVSGLHTYLPISQITDAMLLDGKKHNPIYLVCSNHRHKHCGTPYQSGKIKTVYNLEVSQQHFFRVGKYCLKVHNSNMVSRDTRHVGAQLIRNQNNISASTQKTALQLKFDQIEVSHENSAIYRQSITDAHNQSITDIKRMQTFDLIDQHGNGSRIPVDYSFSEAELSSLTATHGREIIALNLSGVGSESTSYLRNAGISVVRSEAQYMLDLQNSTLSVRNKLTIMHLVPDIDLLDEQMNIFVYSQRKFKFDGSHIQWGDSFVVYQANS